MKRTGPSIATLVRLFVAELCRLGIRPPEASFDVGFAIRRRVQSARGVRAHGRAKPGS